MWAFYPPRMSTHATVLSADPENRELLSRLQVLILIGVANGHRFATKFWGPVATSVFVSRLDPKPVLSACSWTLWLTAALDDQLEQATGQDLDRFLARGGRLGDGQLDQTGYPLTVHGCS